MLQYTLILLCAFLYAFVLISTFQYNSYRDRPETTGNEFYHPIHINYIILKPKIQEHLYITARCLLSQYIEKVIRFYSKLPLLKSLAFHRHRFLPISFVRNCKRTITACFYIIMHKFFSQIKRQPNSGCLLVYLFILR